MTEFVDVVIVGAGISGISAAWHLQDRCPDKSYLILERRDNLGGTWDLFKYPGLRSDSDMYTLGFRFKPYTDEQAIAEGPSILNYLKEAASENGIDKHMRFGQNVIAADWSDSDNRWTLRIESNGEEREISCAFLFGCTGYYNYDEGYSPEFVGSEDFEGTIVHPQHWPEDLEYQDKKIVVIGSGATAVTLIPALIASGSGHVTMLQRTPTYVAGLPDKNRFAARATKWLPEKAAYTAIRWKAILRSTMEYQIARHFPNTFKKALRKMGAPRLPEGFDWDKHFTPNYKPWDQRVCLAPNGDIFHEIRKGHAERRHGHHRAVHEKRHQADLGRGARSRHHRDGNGFEHAAAGRPRTDQGRREDRPVVADDLQGPDVLRCPELRHDVRVHQCLMDVEGRPGLRVRLPAAELHGRQRI